MVKYDYQGLARDCMNERGQFMKGKLFERIGAGSISYQKGYTAELSFSIDFSSGKERRVAYYYIVLSQNGAELKIGAIIPKSKEKEYAVDVVNQATQKLIEVRSELERYKFDAVAYELWSDNPKTPYYIPDGVKSLCSKVVKIPEGK